MKIGTTRAETFSDGVIAIIITIMVLALKLPDFDRDTTSWRMINHLKELIPYFTAYVFSFMMIGIFWTNHHHMFHLLEKTDEHLLWQNLLFLFFMSLIPFATAMIGANPLLSVSSALYGLIMLMTTMMLAVMRHYTITKKLIHQGENKKTDKKLIETSVKGRNKSYIGAAAYLVSIPLAYVHVYLSFVCFAIPPIIFFIPTGIDDEELSNKIEEKNASKINPA
jgi:uncharacterized membrane protein